MIQSSSAFRAGILFVVILIIAFACVDGRGGRGGSRGGSRSSSSRSRYSRSRSGTSGSGYSRSSSTRYYSGPVYRSSMWKTGLAVGMVYGLMSYKRRRLYLRGPDREPRVCFNENNLRNGTYGYFICPEPDLPDNYDYCCGKEGEQKCCTYTKYKEFRQEQKVGGIVGGIVGVVVVGIIVAVLVYCCVIKKRRQRAQAGRTIQKTQHMTMEQQPLAPQGGAAAPMQVFINTQPAAPPGAQPYAPPPAAGNQPYIPPPAGPPPPGYDGGPGGLPYNPSPMGPPSPGGQYPPPQPQPPAPEPIGFKDGQDGLPYSLNPYPPPAPGPGGFVPSPDPSPGGFVPPPDASPGGFVPPPDASPGGFVPPPAPGPGGFVQPNQPYSGPMDPTAPPPPYEKI